MDNDKTALQRWFAVREQLLTEIDTLLITYGLREYLIEQARERAGSHVDFIRKIRALTEFSAEEKTAMHILKEAGFDTLTRFSQDPRGRDITVGVEQQHRMSLGDAKALADMWRASKN